MGGLVTRRQLTGVWRVGGKQIPGHFSPAFVWQSLKKLYLLCSLVWSQVLPGSLPLAPGLWAGVKLFPPYQLSLPGGADGFPLLLIWGQC